MGNLGFYGGPPELNFSVNEDGMDAWQQQRIHHNTGGEMTDIAKKLRDMHTLAAGSCDPEFNRALLEAAAEIERLRGEMSYLTDAVIPALREEIERMRALLSEALNFIESHDERGNPCDKAIDYIHRVEGEMMAEMKKARLR